MGLVVQTVKKVPVVNLQLEEHEADQVRVEMVALGAEYIADNLFFDKNDKAIDAVLKARQAVHKQKKFTDVS